MQKEGRKEGRKEEYDMKLRRRSFEKTEMVENLH
jgi:hypothetical protein